MLILNFHAILEDEYKKKLKFGACLVVQQLRLCTSIIGGVDPGQGTKIPHAVWHGPPPQKNWNLREFLKNSSFILSMISATCPLKLLVAFSIKLFIQMHSFNSFIQKHFITLLGVFQTLMLSHRDDTRQ